MVLWHKSLDPYVTILEPRSSRVLALILDKPGYQVTCHLTIYLSTAGKDPQYTADLALLEDTIDHINEKFPNCILYVRGDSNLSPIPRLNNKRDELFSFFLDNNSFHSVPTNHHTYHHFLNNGQSDSSIDVLLSSLVTSGGFPNQQLETLQTILCSKS